MGVHDYGSIIYNRESEQCLTTFPDYEGDPLLDDDLLILEVWDDELDDIKKRSLADLLVEDHELIEQTISDVLQEAACGENSAYLLLTGNDITLKPISFWLPVGYSWDSWDFVFKKDTMICEGVSKNLQDQNDLLNLGYCDSTDGEMSWKWILSAEILKKLKELIPDMPVFMESVTVFNFTPRAYQILTDPESLKRISNEDLVHMANLSGIPLESIATSTRRTVFNLLRNFLQREISDQDRQ